MILSKEQIEDSLIDYNPIHITNINFDYLHLVNDINNMTIMTSDFEYIFGYIVYLITLYYFVFNIINAICKIWE
jgi:hypothetical protein